MNKKKIEALVLLSGQKRYENFIKSIADSEEVWGLYRNGWALAETDSGQKVFPVWSDKEYAEICAKNEWSGYEPEMFSLSDFMDELLPNLEGDGVLVGVFYTPSDKGVTPAIEKIISDLNDELSKYE